MVSYLRFWLSLFLCTHLLAITMFLGALIWAKVGRAEWQPASMSDPGITPTPLPAVSGPAPPAAPTESSSPTMTPLPPGDSSPPAAAGQLKLIIPVAAVRASELRDTFYEARSQERQHNAIDIMAPRGTAVLAAARGEIVKLFSSDLGGNTIYQLSQDQKMVFYYAHLDRYVEGLAAGHQAQQGEVIAYVGDTGNAGTGNYHLHFAMWSIEDPKRYWHGVNINPYPILTQTP